MALIKISNGKYHAIYYCLLNCPLQYLCVDYSKPFTVNYKVNINMWEMYELVEKNEQI